MVEIHEWSSVGYFEIIPATCMWVPRGKITEFSMSTNTSIPGRSEIIFSSHFSSELQV